ncbi:MAG: hypothetical protein JO006_13360 [Paucibacter sp.]|nr:hypothetical protein [Roseateles sp.]
MTAGKTPGRQHPKQSTETVDNFVGKRHAGRIRAREIKRLHRLPHSWAGKFELKNKRLWLCDGTVTVRTARQPNIGAAVGYWARMGIGFAGQ